MASVNLAVLVGNLGRDPETRYMPDGGAATNCSIATTESWKDKTSGEKQEKTEWHRVSFFGKLAEIAGEYLKKGSLVYIQGRIQTRKWQDKDGADRYTTEIIADRMQMLGGRPASSAPAGTEGKPEKTDAEIEAIAAAAKARRAGSGSFDDFEDDIPFDRGDRS